MKKNKFDEYFEKLIESSKSRDKQKKVKLNTLRVFDWDDTLFRSPEPPKDWNRPVGHWYVEPQSLSTGEVGDSDRRWHRGVLRQAMSKPTGSMTVLLTGRWGAVFGERIKELLESIGLKFDYVGFSEKGKRTGAFKIDKISEILSNNPDIRRIEMWDDRADLLDVYEKTFKKMGYEVIVHHIG